MKVTLFKNLITWLNLDTRYSLQFYFLNKILKVSLQLKITHWTISADLHGLIGVSLVLGFVFMLLVDQCASRKNGGKEKSVTATLGLVVHAAADGVALGAAATTSQADVELIVFVAIMLHKVWTNPPQLLTINEPTLRDAKFPFSGSGSLWPRLLFAPWERREEEDKSTFAHIFPVRACRCLDHVFRHRQSTIFV